MTDHNEQSDPAMKNPHKPKEHNPNQEPVIQAKEGREETEEIEKKKRENK